MKARTDKLLEVGLMKVSKGEYAFATFMHAKKDIFGNWTMCQMHGDYRFTIG